MTDSPPCRHGSPCAFSYHFSISSFIPFASSCSRLQSPPPSLVLSSIPSSSSYPHSLSHRFLSIRYCIRVFRLSWRERYRSPPFPTCRLSRRHPSCIDFVVSFVCEVNWIIFVKRQLTIKSNRSFPYRQFVLKPVRNAFIRNHCNLFIGWFYPAWWLSDH